MAAKQTTQNVPTSDPETISVKYQFMDSLRRSIIGYPPKFNQLRKKLAKSFPEFAHLFEDKQKALRLIYTDDEGDNITITTNDELLVAYRLAHEAGKVLRFTVPKFDDVAPAKVEAVEAKPAPKAAVPEQTPEAVPEAAPFWQCRGRRHRAFFESVKTVVDGIVAGEEVHLGHTCAATGQPIVGNRYTLVSDESQSISHVAYQALPESDRAAYRLHTFTPTSETNMLPKPFIGYAKRNGYAVHRGVKCDVTGIRPIIGNRYKFKGQNYDLCEFAYNQLSPADKENYELFDNDQGRHGGHGRWGGRCGWGRRHHHGRQWRDGSEQQVVHNNVSCDKSGMNPIVGNRYKKMGENYDLCEAEFQKLSQEEKSKFICIKHPQNWHWRQAAGPGCGGFGFGRGRPQFQHPFCPPQAVHAVGVPVPVAQPVTTATPVKSTSTTTTTTVEGTTTSTTVKTEEDSGKHKPKDAANAKFVKDLTVNDKTRKAPNEEFDKGWVMRAGKHGVPAGCMLIFIGGHDLGAADLKVPVENAPFSKGEEFVLKMKFRAPEQPGHYRSFWRMQTPQGRRFGPRIWADIMVDHPQAVATTEAAASPKNSMKFVEDLSIPDGTAVTAGSTIRKTWLIASETGWGEGCVLRCIDMWSSFAGLKEAVPAVPAGSQAEISISLTVPIDVGHYRSYWAMAGPDGQQFGDVLFVEFNAVAPNSSTTSTTTTTTTSTDDKEAGETDAETHAAKAAEAQKAHQAAHEAAVAKAQEEAAKAQQKAEEEAAKAQQKAEEAQLKAEEAQLKAKKEAVNAAEGHYPVFVTRNGEIEIGTRGIHDAKKQSQDRAEAETASGKVGGGDDGSTSDVDVEQEPDTNAMGHHMLEPILAAISLAPQDTKANLSDLLYRALQSRDFTSVIAALAKVGIIVDLQ